MQSEISDVSVIVPAYRAAQTIGRTIQSISAQTIKPREIIIIDDGSDDDTVEIAQAFKNKLGDVSLTILQQEHRGAGAARNFGLLEAKGEYVAFLDADDEWLPKKLECSLIYLKKDNHILVAHNFFRCSESGQMKIMNCVKRFKNGNDPFVALYRYGYIGTSTVVAKRQSLIDAGGFDTTLATGQDFDLWLATLKDSSASFLIFEEPLVRYHVNQYGITSNTKRRLHCCLEIAIRYFPTLKKHTNLPIVSLWFRIFALHYEALTSYWTKKELIGVIETMGLLPFRFLFFSISALRGKFQTRSNNIHKKPNT